MTPALLFIAAMLILMVSIAWVCRTLGRISVFREVEKRGFADQGGSRIWARVERKPFLRVTSRSPKDAA